MLIPQYSIRLLLMVTAACAGVFAIFGLAVRGSLWATGLSVAIVSLVVVLLVSASVFGLVWVFSVVTLQFRRKPRRGGQSPFSQRPTRAKRTAESTPADDKDVPSAPIILEG